MIANPKKLPLSLAKDLQRLLSEIKKVTLTNSDIIEEVFTDKAIYTVKDRDENSDFCFRIIDADQDYTLASRFKVFMKPYVANSLNPATYDRTTKTYSCIIIDGLILLENMERLHLLKRKILFINTPRNFTSIFR